MPFGRFGERRGIGPDLAQIGGLADDDAPALDGGDYPLAGWRIEVGCLGNRDCACGRRGDDSGG